MAVGESIYYDFFDFRLDVNKQQLLKNGEPVQLTHKAFQILLLLVQNSGQITKKEDIFSKLWSDSFVEDGNLTQHIYVLRKALGQMPNGQSYIETVPKQGYRFTLLPEQISVIKKPSNGQSKNVSPEANELDGLLTNQEIAQNNSESDHLNLAYFGKNEENIQSAEVIDEFPRLSKKPSSAKSKIFSRRFLVIAALLLLLGLITSSIVIYYVRSQTTKTTDTNVKSIAVLPFKPISEKIDKEKLGLGMADAIITQLSGLQQIEVRPTSAVFRYTDQPSENSTVTGKELGVDAILEGTLQWEGERVRVSVQLIQVSNGMSLWTETFNEDISDIFAFQDLISRKVVTALSLRLTPQQEKNLAEPGTTNQFAFQDYQMGIYFWNRRTKEDLLKAVEYFQQAIGHDPNYAEAYAGLADSYGMIAFYGFGDVPEMNEKARIAAEKALVINESSGVAYSALANTEIINNNYSKAKELLERAIVLSPYNASTHQRYGFVLLVLGRLDDAVREMRLAQKYDPLSPTINKALCNALISKRNFSEAIEYCQRAVELSPNTPGNRPSLAYAYFHNGRYDDAINQINLEIKSGGTVNSANGSLAYFYVKSGRITEAKKIYEQLKQEVKNDPWVAIDLAIVGFALGKKDDSFVYFKKVIEITDSNPSMRIIIAFDPTLDEIRADPRFASIIPR
jgi:DNA-binding winged helix-turn-helix (wHTH) protein/TolB-like protein/Flp pilus assembly protein TadD